jgi:hypothetical protein
MGDESLHDGIFLNIVNSCYLLLPEVSVAVDRRHFCKAGRKKLKLDGQATAVDITVRKL